MPPFRFSRYSFTSALLDDGERLFLTDREKFRFVSFGDTRTHVVNEGDTLFSLAHQFFEGVPRPSGLWWVIADFQPQPIHDPTLDLRPGRVLFIPSVRTLIEEVFNERRIAEATP